MPRTSARASGRGRTALTRLLAQWSVEHDGRGPLTVPGRVPGSAPAYPHTSLRRATETRSRSTPPTVATKIKLMRLGKMRAPYYRIVVADARTKRDGRSIETIGKYHPKEVPSFIEVNSERAQYWLSVGAQPTQAVAAIFRVTGDWQKFKGEPAPAPMKVAAPKADKNSRGGRPPARRRAPPPRATKRPLKGGPARAGPAGRAAPPTTGKKKPPPRQPPAPAEEPPAADAPAADAPAADAAETPAE